MNNITRFRKEAYDHALSLASEGEDEAALDLLWDLRLKVDLSIYRCALVNITIAAILRRSDRTKYAQECLDLLDLLKQQYHDTANEEELEHTKDLEDAAKEIIDIPPDADEGPNTPQRIPSDLNTG